MGNKYAASSPLQAGKPKVLIVGPKFPKGGGVGAVNQTLLNSRLARDFELIHLDTGRGQAGAGKEGTLSAVNLYYFFSQLFRLLKILVFKRPQILHQSVTWGASFWKEAIFIALVRTFGLRVIAHIHGSKLDVQIKECKPYVKRLFDLAFRIPDVVIVLSELWRVFLYDHISQDLNIVVLPNSVDQLIADAMDENKPTFAGKSNVVLFMGWLCARKGLLDAIQAVPLVQKQVPDVQFVFAGQVEHNADSFEIERGIQRAKTFPGVSFPGFVSGNEKIKLLTQAKVFILPSYNENLPVAIMEAMALGLPVVATSIAGVPEMIDDGSNGYLIQPGDYHSLADRIVILLRDKDLCQRMGDQNITRVHREYCPEVFSQKVNNVYREL